MILKEQIMKLQTYKMYEGEDTVYVERNDVLKALENQPCEDCIEDCISREDAIKVIRKWFDKIQLNGDICLDGIISLPSVTPTRPKGKWKPLNYKDEMWGYVYKCSNCGATEYEYNYCPNCGAKMEVEIEE